MSTPKVVIVTGGRDYADADAVDRTLSAQMPIATLIHGAAPGADKLCAQWAFSHGVEVLSMHADWGKHGYFAGPIRNRAMMSIGAAAKRAGEEVVVLAFPGGKGTANAIGCAEREGLTVIRIEPTGH